MPLKYWLLFICFLKLENYFINKSPVRFHQLTESITCRPNREIFCFFEAELRKDIQLINSTKANSTLLGWSRSCLPPCHSSLKEVSRNIQAKKKKVWYWLEINYSSTLILIIMCSQSRNLVRTSDYAYKHRPLILWIDRLPQSVISRHFSFLPCDCWRSLLHSTNNTHSFHF